MDATKPRIMPAIGFAALALLAVLVVIGPMVGATLGGTDDHEIPVIQRDIASVGVVGAFANRDVLSGRFRPGYWVLRIGETIAWGQDTRGWYFLRAVLLVASLGAAFLIFRRFAGPLAATLGSVVLVAGPQAEAFYRMGPQESYALAFTLVGLALIAYRRIGWGLALLVFAAFTKEPFIVSSLGGAVWAWRLGSRRAALAAVMLIGVAAIEVLAQYLNGRVPYISSGLTIPLAGRYLYPWLIVAAAGAAWLVTRWRPLAIPLVMLVAIGLIQANHDATAWRTYADGFAGLLAQIRQTSGPLVFVADSHWTVEPALAVHRYLPDRPAELVAPVTQPGFTTVSGPCVEVTIWTSPIGRCETVISFR